MKHTSSSIQAIPLTMFNDGTIEHGNPLIDKMTEEQRKRWEEVITSTNMAHNNRKAWTTIRKLSNDGVL